MKGNNGAAHKEGRDSQTVDLELLRSLRAGPLSLKKGEPVEAVQRRIGRLRRDDVEKPTIFIGAGTCGLGAGAKKTIEAARNYVHVNKLDADIVAVGCIGLCSLEPLLDVQLPSRTRICFCSVNEGTVKFILDAILNSKVPTSNVLGQFRGVGARTWEGVPFIDEHPFMAPQRRVVLMNCGVINPSDIDEYIACGGYASLMTVLNSMTPEEVCKSVLDSGIRGRGGAGFPTGRKWLFARQAKGKQKYLICNADEGDPGAFMDRAVCESDPHRLIEGMVIAAYAIGATGAYIYIRAEYPLAIERLVEAIGKAKRYGLLGRDILGSGMSLDIVIKKGAGAFVCGEETALMQSVEGRRGMPRPRPPFPAIKGLFGKPTIINNVETLANIPGIFAMGANEFASIGTEKSKGTKVFALSGMVNRTGLVEIPMGTTLRDIVFKIGGGTPNGKRCKGVQIGGPSGGCVPESQMDIETDYEALKSLGAIMGSGGLVVLDENTCMVDLAKFFMEFIQNESCGKCIPCREGTRRILEILNAITRSRKNEKGDSALLRLQGVLYLKKLAEVIKDSSLCGLGQTAPNPILTALRWFRDEYEAHIFERRCPAGSCKELVGAPCANACPVGTEVWRYVAHVARGEYEQAYRVIREANPFPAVCARVCNHPCEIMCRSGSTGGEPIAIRTLKRFVVDHVDPKLCKAKVTPAEGSAPRIAIIGAGPSGLTAAHSLSLKGYNVTVFEKENRPGGMLVCAIPEYRLPRANLKQEIDNLFNENIELKLNAALGRDFTIDGLFKDGFKAIYLAIGSHMSRALGLKGEGMDGIIHGIDFLKSYNLKGQAMARGRVAVIGGGNSAIDAARVALRQSGVDNVTIFYRRTRQEMPAYEEEIEAALAEGVKIEELCAPVKLSEKGGRLSDVAFIRNRLGECDTSGRRRPVSIPGSEYTVEVDTLIVAIGEEPDTSVIGDLKLKDQGTLDADEKSFQTSRPGVFGGGDLVRGSNTVIDAIADGKRAAVMVDRYLTGRRLKDIPKVKLPAVYIEPVEIGDESELLGQERVHAPMVSNEKRRCSFDEVELCVSESAAKTEAKRCLRCDLEFTKVD